MMDQDAIVIIIITAEKNPDFVFNKHARISRLIRPSGERSRDTIVIVNRNKVTM